MEDVNCLTKRSSFQKEGQGAVHLKDSGTPPSIAAEHPLGGRRQACVSPILTCGPIFHSQTLRLSPILSQRRTQSLRHKPAVASFVWHEIKSIFFSISVFLFSTDRQRPSLGKNTEGKSAKYFRDTEEEK